MLIIVLINLCVFYKMCIEIYYNVLELGGKNKKNNKNNNNNNMNNK